MATTNKDNADSQHILALAQSYAAITATYHQWHREHKAAVAHLRQLRDRIKATEITHAAEIEEIVAAKSEFSAAQKQTEFAFQQTANTRKTSVALLKLLMDATGAREFD